MIDLTGRGSAGFATSWKHGLERRLLLKQHQEVSAWGWRAVGGSSGCYSLISSTLVPPFWPFWPQPCLLDKAANTSPSSGLKSLGQIAETSLKILKWMAFTQTVSLPLVAHLLGFVFDFCFLLLESGFLFTEKTKGLTSLKVCLWVNSQLKLVQKKKKKGR